jgi:transposase
MVKVEWKDGIEQLGERQPPAGTPVWIGIDLSRTKWVYCVRWGGAERRRLSSPGELKHLQALVGQYQGCAVHVAYEACGFGYDIAWWLQGKQMAVTVIAPSRMEKRPGLGVKTDRLDAAKMARKLELGDLKGIYIPRRVEHERRQLARTYGQMLKERKRAQTRIRALLREHGKLGPAPVEGWTKYSQWLSTQQLCEPLQLCVNALLATRKPGEMQAQACKQALMGLAHGAEYRRVVQALSSQPGVGEFSAIRLVLEIGEIERFRRSGAFTHYLGLTPSEYSTGESVQRGHILRCGPGALRAMLVQCGWSAIRGDQGLREVFERLSPRMGSKRAIVAVTRRLALRMRSQWLSAVEQDPARVV